MALNMSTGMISNLISVINTQGCIDLARYGPARGPGGGAIADVSRAPFTALGLALPATADERCGADSENSHRSPARPRRDGRSVRRAPKELRKSVRGGGDEGVPNVRLETERNGARVGAITPRARHSGRCFGAPDLPHCQ